MSKEVRKFFLVLIMVLIPLSLGACGRKPVTDKQIQKIDQQYRDGKVSGEYYQKAYDAYLNGEPLPRRGIIGFFANLIESIILFIVGVGVIAFVVVIFKKRN